MNIHRWEQWLWTCAFALLPLLLWLFLVQVIGVEGDTGAVEASRELLFFSLTICTLALSELADVEAAKRHRIGYRTLNYASLVMIAISAALYGEFLNVQSKHGLLSRIFVFSVGIALAGFVLSTYTQIFVHRGESNAGN